MLRQVHKENRLTERRNEEKLVSVELDMKFPHSEIKISMWSIIKNNTLWKSCYFRAQKRGLCLQTKINQM